MKKIEQKASFIGVSVEDFKMFLENPFQLSVYDGRDTEIEFFKTKEEALSKFEDLKKIESDMHLKEFNEEIGYEVIDSFVYEEVD